MSFSAFASVAYKGIKCQRCGAVFTVGDLRVHSRPDLEEDHPFVENYHLLCALEVDPETLREVLPRKRGKVSEYADLEPLIADAIAERERERRLRAEPAKSPATPRPVVRVLIAGSAFSSGGVGPSHELEALSRERVWSSPLRDYEFVVVRTGESILVDDPARPYVGGVFAAYADAKVLANQRQKLALWQSQGLPTPVLWIFARGEAKTVTDEQVTALREQLDEAGYFGDDALVRTTRVVNRRALDELVAALDERVGASVPARDERPSAMRLAERIERFARASRQPSLNDSLSAAARAIGARDQYGVIHSGIADTVGVDWIQDDGLERLCEAAALALPIESAYDAAMQVLVHPDCPTQAAAVLNALRAFCADPKRRSATQLDALCNYLAKREVAGRAAVLREAIEATTTAARATLLVAAFERCGDRTEDAALVRWSASLGPKDKRAAAVSDSVARIAARASER
jgi:hypothetical protein